MAHALADFYREEKEKSDGKVCSYIKDKDSDTKKISELSNQRIQERDSSMKEIKNLTEELIELRFKLSESERSLLSAVSQVQGFRYQEIMYFSMLIKIARKVGNNRRQNKSPAKYENPLCLP